MLSYLALAGVFSTLLASTSAAPINGLEARATAPEGEPRQIRWLKTTPGSFTEAPPGEYCLQVSNPGFSSGTVDIGGCLNVGPGEDTPLGPGDLQLFYYNLGATKIRVFDPSTGEVQCVDFGNNPSDGSPIRLAQCVDNAPGQNLYITDDLHIAVENGPGQCLDVQAESTIRPTAPYGSIKDVQSWSCSFGNENQIFIFPDTPPPTPPTPPTPEGEPRQIRWLKTTPESPGQAPPGEYCLQVVAPGYDTLGTVDFGYCRDEAGGDSGIGGTQLFYYNLGATRIQVVEPSSGVVRCVDFGDNPADGSPITLSPCSVNSPGQNLFITDDLHIAVENGPGQCLDVQAESGIQPIEPYGAVKSVQSWSCSFGNENQIFIFADGPSPTPPPPPPIGEPKQIRWTKTTPESPGQAAPGVYCLQVSPPGFYSGTIDVGYCFNLGPGETTGSGGPGDAQLFYYNLGATKIRVVDTTTNTTSCVDFGDNPANGDIIRINPCIDNAPGQNLFITDDLHIAVENGPGQCLDVQAESGIQPIKPYGAIKSVQSWTCSAGNENQIFDFGSTFEVAVAEIVY